MKAFGGGDLLDEKLSPFKVKMTPLQCIHYCLTRPGVASIMAGSHSIKEMMEALAYEDASMVEKDFANVLANIPKHSLDRKSTRLNSSHSAKSRMPSSA